MDSEMTMPTRGPIGGQVGVGLAGVTNRESEMTKVLGKLHAVIEANYKAFNDLDVRISPILRGDVPEKNGSDQLKPGYSSALATELSNCVDKLDGLYNYIMSVRNRVEL